MPEILLISLAKNLFRIFKNEVRNLKKSYRGFTPPINPSLINKAPQSVLAMRAIWGLKFF